MSIAVRSRTIAAGGATRASRRRDWVWVVRGLGLAFAVPFLATDVLDVQRDVYDGLYGAVDGVLLSVFPILAVFHAFEGRPVLTRLRGKAAVALLALAVSVAFTATYHLGYPDFRGSKLAKPLAGDVVWSMPTLLTLSPLGAPIAHAGLHVAAVVHDYQTDLFLPPHPTAKTR